MPLRPRDELFGGMVPAETLALPRAVAVSRLVIKGDTQGFRFEEARRSQGGAETLIVRVQVDRPQQFVHPLKPVEIVALHFDAADQPRVLSLRDDFPATPHQNPGHKSDPISLCIDDRPWPEARPSWTPTEFLVRIQRWFAKTARGELHGNDRAPEPLFVQAGPIVIIEREVLNRASAEAFDLAVYRVDASTRREVLLTSVAGQIPPGHSRVPVVMMAMAAGAQDMANIRFPPRTFGELADELRPLGVDLRDQIKRRLRTWVSQAWATPKTADVRNPEQLASRLGVVVAFQVRNEGMTTTGGIDFRAFLTAASMAEIGVKLGCLGKDPNGLYGQILALADDSEANDLRLLCCEVHLGFDRDLAWAISGHTEPDARRVTLIGAGAVGSHVANALAREGLFTWTVIDEDHLLPHNHPRHVLPPSAVGLAKAGATAGYIDEVLGRPGTSRAIVADILDPADANATLVNEALAESELLLDGSASVAVARHLSDLTTTAARRVSFFFNPDGTDAVLLMEPRDRSATLRELEAQYYSMLVTTPGLYGHLQTSESRIAYSGACRRATNRMPESRVATLSALIAIEMREARSDPDGCVVIWRITGADVRCIRSKGDRWERSKFGAWHIVHPQRLSVDLTARRTLHLPAETGGVLLGVVDSENRSIHLCVALGPPADSVGNSNGFERGTAGLKQNIAWHGAETAGQLSYVGEWHSHPTNYPTKPSITDAFQLSELAHILDMNGVPAVMAIVGDDGLRLHTADIVDIGVPLTVIKIGEQAQ